MSKKVKCTEMALKGETDEMNVSLESNKRQSCPRPRRLKGGTRVVVPDEFESGSNDVSDL